MLKEEVSKIIEGKAILKVPENYLKKSNFYNPISEISRDFTVIFVNNIERNDLIVCDALSAIGARGIRIALECKNVKEVWFNDYSKDAIEILKENVKINNIENKAKIFCKDANVLLSENKRIFDYIDIDPFGSPIYFLDSVARAIKRDGYIGITATDTQALIGINKNACLRKYGIFSFRNDMLHDIGIRNLIYSLSVNFSKYMFSFKPIISFHNKHFYRVFGHLKKGRKMTNENIIKNIGIVLYCKNCLNRKFSFEFEEICNNCNKKFSVIYPTWIGEINDKNFINKILNKIHKFNYMRNFEEIEKTLVLLKNEINAPCYDLHEISSKYKVGIKKTKEVVNLLKDASLVHFSTKAIKTNKNINYILEILKK
ncbi:MAG: tRNA (guanine(10)-N(2))-dimethyltransferase [Candidatus Aenigmatarchaeota archaeon]